MAEERVEDVEFAYLFHAFRDRRAREDFRFRTIDLRGEFVLQTGQKNSILFRKKLCFRVHRENGNLMVVYLFESNCDHDVKSLMIIVKYTMFFCLRRRFLVSNSCDFFDVIYLL